jgi:hypothetical protein
MNLLFINNHMNHTHRDTELTWFTQSLGYVHNDWLFYYALCNHSRLVHCATIDSSCYQSPPCLATLQCKPLSKTLPKPLDIDSLSFSVYSLNRFTTTKTLALLQHNFSLFYPTHYIFIHRI